MPVGTSQSPLHGLQDGSSGDDVEVEVNAVVEGFCADEHRVETTICVSHDHVAQLVVRGKWVEGVFFSYSFVSVLNSSVCFCGSDFN